MVPASATWAIGVLPQSGPASPPPLLEPPLLEPLELPELVELPLLELVELPLELLEPLELPLLEPPLLLLHATAETPPAATVNAVPKTKVRARMFIASTFRVRPRVLPGGR
jgi:hypothetical protein